MDLLSYLRRLLASPGVRQHDVVPDSEPATPWYYPLSKREAELAELIAAGSTNLEIATRTGMPKRVIDARVAWIMDKLEVRKRAEIAAWVAPHRPA
jgi:DNA-binding NarL/FixJ family response regulator